MRNLVFAIKKMRDHCVLERPMRRVDCWITPACEKMGPRSPRTLKCDSVSQGQRVGFGKRSRLKETRDQSVLHGAGRRSSSRTSAFNGCETLCLQLNKMSRAVTVSSASGTIVIRDAKIMFEPSSYDGTAATNKTWSSKWTTRRLT